MGIRVKILGLLVLVPCLASGWASQTLSYANMTPSSSTSSESPTTSNCCFVVQDTLTENWWQIYSTEPVAYYVVNLTSITALVTPYMDTTVTNYETNIYTTNASYTQTDEIGQNPVSLFFNNAPQPAEMAVVLGSSIGSQVVTAGKTIQSPAAFWAFSTVKVITVPAVTDSDGNVVCATPSVLGYNVPSSEIYTVSGINSNAEAYFGGPNIASIIRTSGPNGLTSTIPATTETGPSGPLTTRPPFSFPVPVPSTYIVDTANNTINVTVPYFSGTVVSFPTPFIYFPARGVSGKTGEGFTSFWTSGSNEDFGYVPKTVIDYMGGIPAISSQYPGITSCLPGGPSIIYEPTGFAALPTYQFIAPDLTSTTVITISGSGQKSAPRGLTPLPSPTIPSAASAINPPATSQKQIPSPSSQSPTIALSPSPNNTPTQSQAAQSTIESAITASATPSPSAAPTVSAQNSVTVFSPAAASSSAAATIPGTPLTNSEGITEGVISGTHTETGSSTGNEPGNPTLSSTPAKFTGAAAMGWRVQRCSWGLSISALWMLMI